MSVVWSLLLLLYVFVALAAVVRTMSEATRSTAATPLGTTLGCVACLFWPVLLPIFFVMTREARRMPRRDLSSGL